jgi:hypothetical protein
MHKPLKPLKLVKITRGRPTTKERLLREIARQLNKEFETEIVADCRITVTVDSKKAEPPSQ